MTSVKGMTLDVTGLNQTLANLVGLSRKMKTHIARVCIAKGASEIRKPLVSRAVANGYPSLSKAMGIDLKMRRGGAFYAKIGAVARYKIVGTRRVGGKVIFNFRQRADRFLASTGAYWSQVVHLMEFGTKPHQITVKLGRRTVVLNHPGAKPIPLFRPVWDGYGAIAQQAMENRVWPEILKALSGVK